MSAWILILVFAASSGISTVQLGGYATQVACQTAGNGAMFVNKGAISSPAWGYVCVQGSSGS
jgi:hypothetical protein